MTKSNYVLLIFILLPVTVSAQFQKSDWELGFMGNFGWTEVKVASGAENISESVLFANISAIPTYYLFGGIALDLEVSYLAAENDKPGMWFIGNLSYTHRVSDSKFAPFIRAGYGVGNAMSSFTGQQAYPEIVFDDFKVGILNSGIGLKYLLSDFVAFRSEFNYRRSNINQNIEGLENKVEITVSNLALWLGVSLQL